MRTKVDNAHVENIYQVSAQTKDSNKAWILRKRASPSQGIALELCTAKDLSAKWPAEFDKAGMIRSASNSSTCSRAVAGDVLFPAGS